MIITTSELENVEKLLNSTDKSKIELGLTILSGFTFNESGVNWLINYYQKLAKEAKENQQYQNLQAVLLGTVTSEPTKASRVLTMLLEQTDLATQKHILETLFIDNNTLKLPRLELDDFPKAIFEFSNLESIVWQYGNLKVISVAILQLPQLSYLDVRHQPLEMIAEKITEHKKLKEIWIRNALIVSEDLIDAAKFDIFIEAAY